MILLLLMRMVPDSLSRAFLLARIQPLLPDARRATWLSLQSFAGRLLFAGSLIVFSGEASDDGAMAYDEIRSVLSWYVGAGLLILAGLVLSVRRARMNEAT